MSQHDYNIANGGGAAVRADINNALLAILSQNSGATAPTTTKPFMFWYDTTTGVLKMRNAADTAWVDAITGVSGGNGLGMVNRVINGGAAIDQRVNGTVNTSGVFIVDRWLNQCTVTSKISAYKSGVTPSGFTASIGATVTAAYTAGAADAFGINHRIEGSNIADLAFGSLAASAATLSFWVRSSVTGTYSGSIRNGGSNRSYPFTYTINSANTWEQKSVTIQGDTTGTWAVDNSTGLDLWFDLGSGSNFNSTAGVWAAGNYVRASGAVSWNQTAGATFYITGVDFRKGTFTSAPAWDWRPYGTELALCQRYFAKTYDTTTVPGTVTASGAIGTNVSATWAYAPAGTWCYPVAMRAVPTITLYSTQNANTTGVVTADATDGAGTTVNQGSSSVFIRRNNNSSGVASGADVRAHATASAEL